MSRCFDPWYTVPVCPLAPLALLAPAPVAAHVGPALAPIALALALAPLVLVLVALAPVLAPAPALDPVAL
eukprot:81097-Alexandrium_andersonii.AAC.1